MTQDAALMWPFVARTRDFALYYLHDVPIAGLGSLFSGALPLAASLTVLTRPQFEDLMREHPRIYRDLTGVLVGLLDATLGLPRPLAERTSGRRRRRSTPS